MITIADVQDARDMTIAKDVAETLYKHYPLHMWAVTVRGGIIFIKNMSISSSHGMTVFLDSYYSDPGNTKIIRFAGELLERANLRRGKDTGDEVTHVEGLAENYQPINGLIR